MKKAGTFSVAKAILAVLWQKERADTRALLNHRYLQQLCGGYHATTYRTSVSRLLRKGFLQRGNGIFLLTEQGKSLAFSAYLDAEARLHRPDSGWDGGWRIIFFDIPEKKRKQRDFLRGIIKRIGFKELQKSIWVYPYPVPSLLKDAVTQRDIKDHVRFIITEAVENDHHLRNLFRLAPYQKS